jgi:ribA/ribD-fused uncharacterized protein
MVRILDNKSRRGGTESDLMRSPKRVKLECGDASSSASASTGAKKRRHVQPVLCYAAPNDTAGFYGYSNTKRARRQPKMTTTTGGCSNNNNSGSMKYEGLQTSDKANFFLSPLYPDAPFVLNKVRYRSVAHFMQAMKWSHDPLFQAVILATEDPLSAIHLGKNTLVRAKKNDAVTAGLRRIVQNRTHESDTHYRRPDWRMVRERFFLTANICKFAQHPELKAALLATAPHSIVEDSDDAYWGGGGGNTTAATATAATAGGQNRAGRVLERTREILGLLEAEKMDVVKREPPVGRDLFDTVLDNKQPML